MCLLFTRVAGTSAELSDAWLKDFYARNRDGYGVMYAEDGVLYTSKGIGSAEDWIKFFRQHEHRTAAFHLRMKTHGDIDMTNCHPYEIYGDGAKMPVYIMHNGVLHTGNDRDRSKSDTWHFVRDYIIPLTKEQPEVIFTPEFEKVIGKFVGNNRFALLNHLGELQVVNESQGVRWNGMWLSNTYAWDYYAAMPEKRPAPTTYSTYGNKYSGASSFAGQAKKATTVPKGGDKKSSTKSRKNDGGTKQGKQDGMDEATWGEVVAAWEDIDVRSKRVSSRVTYTQLNRFFKELGDHDAWAYVEAFTYSEGVAAEDEFLAALADPRKALDWLNRVENISNQFATL